ncbi:hypothetical protein KP509_36G059500 [Ceratopteris richardii]|uniref:Endonuclease/exonuclease/phosphatase domain-containing protein n=1 Tax=Ceratopteris richardii TaxID=49495 RepID=A0A8T2QDN0_CERRI|nr:hypothetical protein KP509_36G059500 [Ceratopteris richardii]
MFHERDLLLFFTTRIPLGVDVARAINANVDKEVVDKVFYSGHGLFEVIFNDNGVKSQFLEQETIFLCGLMAHVFPLKLVKAMKEELLYKCRVWVELIDLPSFLWSSIGHVAKILGKLLYTPSISTPNKNRVCVLWNTSKPFPKTLAINVLNVGRIVIYLKWGSMAGSCFHSGNLGHYSKNCPTLKSEGVNLIPTCLGSKILVPEEQIFGRQRTIRATSYFHTGVASRPSTSQVLSNKGKEIAVEKKIHPPAPITPAKLNVYKRREGEGTCNDTSKKGGEEAGKKVIDNDGFASLSYKKTLLRGKRSKFQFGYSASPVDKANFAPHSEDGLGSGIGSHGSPSCYSTDDMKLASWNIQGLGQYGKWTRLWRWIIRHQLDFMAIQEHKKHDHAGMLLDTKDFFLQYNGIQNKYSGCLFIIRRGIAFKVLFNDPNGRFIILHLLVQKIPYICINVYAPNSPMERVKTWKNLLHAFHLCARLQEWSSGRILMCGDFNMVDVDTDFTTPSSFISTQESLIWNEIVEALNCRDLRRLIGRHTLRYTFHSRSHRNAMSRLDRCYYSHVSTLHTTSTMWIDAMVLLSYQNPILISLQESDWNICIPDKLHRIPMRLNHAWFKTSVFKSRVEDLIQQALTLKTSACMKWEFIVSHMQDVIRECGKYFVNVLKTAKVGAEHIIVLMSEKIDSGELLSERDYNRLCDAYRCLQLIENNAIESSKARAKCVEVNDLHANSKCFFDFLRTKRAKSAISSLEVDGQLLCDGNSIALACTEHFEKLFAASHTMDDAWFSYLKESLDYTPQVLDTRAAEALEKHITEEEVFIALCSLKNGKAPGMDGLTKEFVISFWPSLKELTIDVCNEIWRDQKMPSGENQAYSQSGCS